MGRRRRKKEDTPIEIVIPIFITLIAFSKNNNIDAAIKTFIITFIVTIVISFMIRYSKKEKRRKKLLNSGIDIVDKMTGEEFEDFCLVHFKNLGYQGNTTPKTNDYGADLILNKQGEKIVVQAKRWNVKVGIEAVQQIIGARGYYKANKCIVITNNYFTPNAENLANSSNVELWNRNKLLEIMSRSDGREIAKEVTKYADIDSRKICPKCGAEMISKSGQYGEFYGCSKFPKCKCTVKINR